MVPGCCSWSWNRTSIPIFATAGHDVFPITLTGPRRTRTLPVRTSISILTWDVVVLLFHEDLREVILVGTRKAAMVSTGGAEFGPLSACPLCLP